MSHSRRSAADPQRQISPNNRAKTRSGGNERARSVQQLKPHSSVNVSTNKISNGGGKALGGNLCARCESDIKTDATPKTVPTNSHQHQQSETRSRSRVSMRRSKMLPPPPFPRTNYSAATPIELEIQREQRVRARRLASAPPRPVQRHAEMRAFLKHCRRVIEAKPIVCTRPSTALTVRSSSATPSKRSTSNSTAASSVTASKRTEKRLSYLELERERARLEENRRLLRKLFEIANTNRRSQSQHNLSSIAQKRK